MGELKASAAVEVDAKYETWLESEKAKGTRTIPDAEGSNPGMTYREAHLMGFQEALKKINVLVAESKDLEDFKKKLSEVM